MATPTRAPATATERAQRREFRFTLLVLALVFVATLVTAARGQEPLDEQRVQRVWDASWKPIAAHYVPHGEGFVFFARTGDTPSSLGLTAEQHARATAREFELMDDKGRVKKQVYTKPAEECTAWVKAPPKLAPGEYGFIHSGRVEEVDTAAGVVVLSEVWYVDAPAVRQAKEDEVQDLRRKMWSRIEDAMRDRGRGRANIAEQRFEGQDYVDFRYENREELMRRQMQERAVTWRLEGVPVRGAIVGQRWPAGNAGLALAIVEQRGNGVTAVGVDRLRKGLTEEQFTQAMAQRGRSVAQFADLAVKAKQEAPRQWADKVIAALEPGAGQ